MNIITATIDIQGTRPLLWHSFGAGAIPLEKQEKTGVPGNDPEEWKRTVLAKADGQLYLNNDYAFGSIRDGARYTKKGKSSLQKNVSATLQIVERKILIDRWLPDGLNSLNTDDAQPVYLDVRSVRNPSTKGRNVRYRVAASPGWKARFSVEWDKTIVSRGELESCIRDAGTLVGIGDGRTMGFGRFKLCSFEVMNAEAPAA